MESDLDWHSAHALLAWQVELGVTEAMCDAPVNRYEAAAEMVAAQASVAAVAATARPQTDDPVAEAQRAAQSARTLDELAAAMTAYDHCELKKGARNLVFCDGTPGARVMIIGEAPGRDEDQQGRPFVGKAGQLLDRMFAAIGIGRDRTGDAALYITNVLPWRPPQNRDPKPDEIAMMQPFLQRHVELAAPDILVVVGNVSCQAVLGKRGITRLRGQWDKAYDRPVLPMVHPAYLLRTPTAKHEAWADLLELQARLKDTPKGKGR
ncbi:uracil-DNA glycosylase family protein [Puniceibacterium sp. IMCC21224]|uniref:uracil-DNA glycosylase n=1 Tax=Puniceibacterium sp. IMCC21224 TaxID=1618204 RepID=UPI00064D8FBF|nr:uracil-DNA glycosylase [Puniceibacterium sp. IMCC21224]KMK66595.1 uracil-DNA glycosylase, family 4 [Puniceibacterium sp. IMCC21224]